MDRVQVEWASKHDWYIESAPAAEVLTDREYDPDDLIVRAREVCIELVEGEVAETTLSIRTFHSLRQLMSWAGY